jgi:hypothetical protein
MKKISIYCWVLSFGLFALVLVAMLPRRLFLGVSESWSIADDVSSLKRRFRETSQSRSVDKDVSSLKRRFRETSASRSVVIGASSRERRLRPPTRGWGGEGGPPRPGFPLGEFGLKVKGQLENLEGFWKAVFRNVIWE